MQLYIVKRSEAGPLSVALPLAWCTHRLPHLPAPVCPRRYHSQERMVAYLPSALDKLLVPRRCVVGPFAGLAGRPSRDPVPSNTSDAAAAAMKVWKLGGGTIAPGERDPVGFRRGTK